MLADVPLIGKLIDKDQLEKDLETTKEDIKNSLSDLKDASIEFGIGVDAEKVKGCSAAGSKLQRLLINQVKEVKK